MWLAAVHPFNKETDDHFDQEHAWEKSFAVTLQTKPAISFLLAPYRSQLTKINALRLLAEKRDA
jgi:hypothetical protein